MLFKKHDKPNILRNIFKYIILGGLANMSEYPNTLKNILTSIIDEMLKSPELFIKNSKHNFKRNRKLPFKTMIQLLLSMGGKTIYKELLDFHADDINTPTSSAFVQQRDKILSFAFEFLFHNFVKAHKEFKKDKGYRLLAVDGSDLKIPTDPKDSDNYFQVKNSRGYSFIHLNTMYDLHSQLYVDAKLQPRRKSNECKALVEMIDDSNISDPVILIADRGYESYNVIAHLEKKNWKYVIRVKDVNSSGILSAFNLPSKGEFDILIARIFTKKKNKEVRSNPECYRKLHHDVKFDFLNTDFSSTLTFRAVRFKTADNSYATVITNLDESDFKFSEIKKLYEKRWGIETSFRALKYTIGLMNFHAKKREYIAQEVFAKMTMYNFSEMVASHATIVQVNTKHAYQTNFTIVVYICRHFLLPKSNISSLTVEAVIRKNILPIRPNRKVPRNSRNKTAPSFNFRIA